MAISVTQLQAYMRADFNILITGQAGTGKTAMLKKAADNLGLKMKYYSASTLDPFADLVGLPIPDMETRSVEYFRPTEVDDAEIIFFDELNRADTKTLNTVFEIIQFRSINGERLPKLKCVVAAINPVEDGYDTEDLDIALVDRFDIYLESKVDADYNYLKAKFGPVYARAGKKLFDEYQVSYNSKVRSNKNKLGYFSPRRLEKLMEIFIKFPKAETVRAVLPANVIVPAKHVTEVFNEALNINKTTSKGNATPQGVGRGGLLAPEDAVEKQIKMTASDLRRKANAKPFLETYRWAKANDTVMAAKLLGSLAGALSYGVGPATIRNVWGEAVDDFGPSQKKIMMIDWHWNKKYQVQAALRWL